MDPTTAPKPREDKNGVLKKKVYFKMRITVSPKKKLPIDKNWVSFTLSLEQIH